MFILTLGQILTWGFDQVYNFYNPLVYDTGDILDTYIFRTALADIRFNYAAAAGFSDRLFAPLLLVSNKIVKLFGEESILIQNRGSILYVVQEKISLASILIYIF